MMVTVLTLDPLTKRLRDYFACPTLEGAYLEQQGNSGSVSAHFERRIFMNEVISIRECYLKLSLVYDTRGCW